MTTTQPGFRIHPIQADALRAARTSDRTARVTAAGGEALRCCLTSAGPGDELILFSYQPPLPDSPYRETGAVLAHAHPCPGPADLTTYPRDWRGRPQVLRAYDDRGWIHDATTVHDGNDPAAAIAEVLSAPGVAQVHSRNVEWGCYMFTVTRDTPSR